MVGIGKKTGKNHCEALIFLALFMLFMAIFAGSMGVGNMLNTMMNTAYSLLMNTCFYLMAITVLMGAIAALLSEFGVVDLLNSLLSPLIRPLYGLPGAATIGVISTYLSDNPAILTLAEDKKFRSCFRLYQIPALTNIGTAFGMGLIVTTYILGFSASLGSGAVAAAIYGNIGAIVGSIVSTRLMLCFTKKQLGDLPEPMANEENRVACETETQRPKIGIRFMNAIMEGGKNGVKLGMGIIPGVVIICTFVALLTYGAPEGGVYTGGAFEGVALLTRAAEKCQFILKPLFGFTDPKCIAVPMTALGSVGAALGMIDGLVKESAAGCNDLAVFTAIGMCWSGYLSTHVAMMDVLGFSRFSGKAIFFHTIGGICAGIAAHWLYVLLPF